MKPRTSLAVLAGIIGLALLAGPVGRADIAIEQLPAETNFVARLDLESLRATSAYRELTTSQAGKHARFLAKFEGMTGIAPTSIRRAWLAGVGKGEGALLLEAEVNVDDLAAVAASHPDWTRQEMVGTRFAVSFPDRRDQGRTKLGVMTDAGLIVVGDPAYVGQVLAVTAGTVPGLSADASARVAATLAGPGLFRAVMLALPPEAAAKRPALAGLSGAVVVADLVDDFTFRMDLTFAAEEQAMAVSQIAEGMLGLQRLAASAPANASVRDRRRDQVRRNLCDNVAVTRDGCELRIASRVDAAVIGDVLAELGQ